MTSYYYGAKGALTQNVSANAGAIVVNTELAGVISANFNGNSWFMLKSGNTCEVVKVTDYDGTTLYVDRAQEGTLPAPFFVGTEVSFVLTASAVLEEYPAIEGVEIEGSGIVQVSNPSTNVFGIEAQTPTFNGSNGVFITGTWPEYTIGYTPPDDNCCGSGSSSSGEGITDIAGSGIIDVYQNENYVSLNVDAPNFTTSGPITITGTWPNYTVTVSVAGGGGTVTSVNAGTGLALTGSPTVNPTLLIANTGVAAGTYAGVVINARGQFTAVPGTFAPISVANSTSPIHVARTAGSDTINITVDDGAIGVKGVLELADPDDDFDPNDDTHAASPAVIAKALETLVLPSVANANNYTGEVSTDYTAPIGSTTTAIVLASGEQALVRGMVTMVDGTTPLTPVAFGVAVFDATPSVVKSNRKITQSSQMIEFMLNGPVNTALTLVTTAVPAGATVQSYSFTVQKF